MHFKSKDDSHVICRPIQCSPAIVRLHSTSSWAFRFSLIIYLTAFYCDPILSSYLSVSGLGTGCSGAAAHRAVESPSSPQSSGNCRPSAIYWSLCLICLGCTYSSLQSVPLGCAFPLAPSTFALYICEPDVSFCAYTFKIVHLGWGFDPVTTISMPFVLVANYVGIIYISGDLTLKV